MFYITVYSYKCISVRDKKLVFMDYIFMIFVGLSNLYQKYDF